MNTGGVGERGGGNGPPVGVIGVTRDVLRCRKMVQKMERQHWILVYIPEEKEVEAVLERMGRKDQGFGGVLLLV